MRIFLIHPNKPYNPSLANCLSQELQAIAKLLIGHEVAIYDDPNLATSRLEWCDHILCFGFDDLKMTKPGKLTLDRIIESKKPISFVTGDPDYWGISKSLALLPQCTGKLYVPIENMANARAMPISMHSMRPSEYVYLPFWHMMFANSSYLSKPWKPIGEKSLCYIGHNRSEYRTNRLLHFMHSNRFRSITYSAVLPKGTVNHINYKKCFASEAMYNMREHGANLVVGDEHYDLLLPYSHRILQGWATNTPTFIDHRLVSDNCELGLPGVVQTVQDITDVLNNEDKLASQLEAQMNQIKLVQIELWQYISKPNL